MKSKLQHIKDQKVGVFVGGAAAASGFTNRD